LAAQFLAELLQISRRHLLDPRVLENARMPRAVMRIPGFEVTMKMWNYVTEQLEIHFYGVQDPSDRPPGIGDILGESLSYVRAQIMKLNGVPIENEDAVAANVLVGAE
jgi:hypothetical protein